MVYPDHSVDTAYLHQKVKMMRLFTRTFNVSLKRKLFKRSPFFSKVLIINMLKKLFLYIIADSEEIKTSLSRDIYVRKSRIRLAFNLLIITLLSTSFLHAADVDLRLNQQVNNTQPDLGQNITYTLYVVNESSNTATNVVVSSNLPVPAVNYLTHSTSTGSATFSTSTLTWSIPSINPGDSVKIDIDATVLSRGVYFAISEITSSTDNDVDSTPGNNVLSEDDLASSCFSVPLFLYPGDEYTVSIPPPYNTGDPITWYKNSIEITPSTPGVTINPDQSLSIQSIGSYTFETTANTCPATGCCPIQILEGPYGSIGDFVWLDTNNDGLQTSGETGIENVKVYLKDQFGAILDSTLTSSTGAYLFDSLLDGNYQIQFILPADKAFTLANNAASDSLDSDVDILGNSPIITLELLDGLGNPLAETDQRRNNTSVDAGLYQLIFDLALRKTVNPSTVVAGSPITFEITLFNQGNMDATDITVIDSIGSSITVIDTNWIENPMGYTILQNPISFLAAGQDTTISITFLTDPNSSGNFTNYAEISSAFGPGGQTVTDIDSEPNFNLTSDDLVIDDAISDPNDEDDHDIAIFTVEERPIFDLALVKRLVTPEPIYPRNTITFEIDVINQGTVNATNVQVVDYLPTGFTLSSTDWTVSGNTATYNSLLSVLVGDTATISLTGSLNFDVTGSITNMAEISSAQGPGGISVVDEDSNFDNDPFNEGTIKDDNISENGKNGGDEDDSDIADVPISQYASIGDFVWLDENKNGIQDDTELGIQGITVVLDSADFPAFHSTVTDQNGFYFFNNLYVGVEYKVRFIKDGTYEFSPQNAGSDLTKDSDAEPLTGESLPIILGSGEFNQTIDAGLFSASCESITSILASNGNICVGDSTSIIATSSGGTGIDWYLTPNSGILLFSSISGEPVQVAPTTTAIYYAALSNLAPGCDTDREPIAIVVNARPSNPSCIKVIEICDGETTDLSTHIINGITTPGGVFEWRTGADPSSPLVTNINNAGAGTYYLFEKSGAGCYSNPAQVTVLIKPCDKEIDLSLIKIANRRTVEINDIITYTLTIHNEGPDEATGIVIQDVLPSSLNFISSTQFTSNAGTLTASIPSLASGTSIALSYQAQVTQLGSIINVAEIIAADQVDKDSTPGNGATMNEDDDDDEIINVITTSQVADLRLQKYVSDNTPKKGDLITYTIIVRNDGPDAATNVEVEDILPAGLTYVSASGSDGITIFGSTIVAQFNSIASGASDDFIVLAQVDGTGSITNTAQVTASSQSDPDSTPDTGTDEDDDDSVTITVEEDCNPNVPVIYTNNPYICIGESTALVANGCNGTVVWSNGQTGTTISVSPSTNTIYTAVCQVNTCTSANSNMVAIMVNTPAPPLVSASKTSICNGETVTLTASGCNANVVWSDGSTGNSIVVSPSSTTTYTATCSFGTCTSDASQPINIQVGNGANTPTIAASKTEICTGESVNLTATACTGVVNWSNGQTGTSINVSPTANTTYTATCVSGVCTSLISNTISISVGSPSTPTITATETTICSGSSTTITANNCSGNVLWSNGATSAQISVSPLSTSTYTVTCGSGTCAATANITINVSGGTAPLISTSNNTICFGESTTLTASGCNGTLTWSNGASTAEITVSPTQTTTYTASCTVSSCTLSSDINITVRPLPAAPIVTLGKESICAGESVTVTANNCNGTVNWTNGQTGTSIVVTPTTTESYIATCVENGCESIPSSEKTITVISETPVITASKSSICIGDDTQLTVANCSGSISWSTGASTASITVSPTSNTTYTVTCTNNTCTASSSMEITINQGLTPVIIASKTNICAGESVNLSVANCANGVHWNTGVVANNITVEPLTTTSYTATCGEGSCAQSAVETITVESGGILTVTANKTSICSGESVIISASGCTETISWSNGATGNEITVSPASTTTYTATCGTSTCAKTGSIEINVGSGTGLNPTITASKTSICQGESVTLSAGNCNGAITWSNGANNATITVSPTVTTTYTATCSSGTCSGEASQTITVGSGSSLTLVASKNTVCPGDAVELTASGCSETVVWSTSATGNIINVNPASTTTYSATCGTGNCAATASITINITNAPVPSITASETQLCAPIPVILTQNDCFGTITWSNGSTGNSTTVNPAVTSTYSVNCLDACGVNKTAEITITVGTPNPPSISATGTEVCAGSQITLNAINCSGTVIWSNGMTGASINVTPSQNTTYTAVCELAGSNCTSGNSNSVTISIISGPLTPVITCTATRICEGESVTLSALNCSGTVTWSTGATGESITVTPLATTVYTATCKVGNCDSPTSAPATITVGKPIAPIVSCQNTLICSGQSTILKAEGCAGTVIWSNGMTGAIITVSPSVVTTYTAICDAGLCQSETSNAVTVAIAGSGVAKPTVTALTNICPNTTVDLSVGVTSNIVSQGGSFVFRTANDPNSTAVQNPSSIGVSGSYFVFESTGAGCYSEGAQIDVAIISCETPPNCNDNPATAFAGNDTTLCLKEDVINLNGSIGGSAQSGTWTTNGSGVFGNATSPITTYKFSLADLQAGSVRLTLTTNDPDNGGPCTAATSSILVTTNAIATKPTITTVGSTTICLGDSVTLTADQDASSYLWSTGATSKSIKVGNPGEYSVRLSNAEGCSSLLSDPVLIELNSSLTPPSVTAQGTNTCPSTTVNLNSLVNGSPATNGGVFEFRIGSSPLSNLVTNPTAVSTGTYYVYEKSSTGCYSIGSQISVSIESCETEEEEADIAVDIVGNKSSITLGDEVTYTITITNNGPANATNVKVDNTLPAGLELVGGTPGLMLFDNVLKATIPSLGVGESKTYTYVAKVKKTGIVSNKVDLVSLDQTDLVLSNNSDKFDVECSTCQEACIATSLKADTLKLENGSWDISFTALVENCGNIEFTAVELLDDLSIMFPSPSTFTLKVGPSVNTGSQLVPNASFNGSSDINILSKNSSRLAAGKVDTVKWTINLIPNGAIGPFSTNSIAKGTGLSIFETLEEVSDVSNDGMFIEKVSASPTIVRLYRFPAIALSLGIQDTTKLQDGSYDILYKAIVKNSGSVSLNNVILHDSLFTTFVSPATFSVKSIKNSRPTSSVQVNPNFNGTTDNQLTLATSTMEVGQIDTICYVVNVLPGEVEEFSGNAFVEGKGTPENSTEQTVTDISNAGFNPDAPGRVPTKVIFTEENTNNVLEPCIGMALYVEDSTKMADGSFDITYAAILKNCGNVNLSNVSICDTLATTFNAPSEAKIVGDPSVNSGSLLKVDTSFNGVDKTCMLLSTSSLAPGKTDTLKWVVNVTLNSNNGPFRNNVTVVATTGTGQQVSDISNNGTDPNPVGSDPTVLNFNNLPNELIGLAKEVESIENKGNDVFDVVFKFNVKNYGITDFNRVQVQDNLAATFGNKVRIDSVKVFETSSHFVANPIFTGKGQLLDLLVDSSSTLARNQSGFIKLFVRVDISQSDSLRFENIAMAIGFTNNNSTNDQSTTGSNPDPDADGFPKNNTIPTEVLFEGVRDSVAFSPLGIAKNISDTTRLVDGSYNITYQVIVKNFGDSTLTSVMLTDSLDTVFSDSTDFSVLGIPTLSSGSKLKINPDFDGIVDKGILADSSILEAGVTDTVTFRVKVRNNKLGSQTYNNSIFGTAVSNGVAVGDKSQSGLNPDADGNNNPADNSEPTAITLESAVDADTTQIPVKIYKGLSPNGDGFNDKFVIEGITERDEVSVKIYNRWGHLVFQSDNYRKDFPEENDGWNGEANTGLRIENGTSLVPDGTYFYNISSPNGRLFNGKPTYSYITVVGTGK